ncbi:hypothetical protein ATE49_12480 [Elizabethkingia miricola]|uniref:Uncharacterized protein n=1 Tax=Elizabethkingia miricola TaxID=172045 RepID=A0ABY3NCN1_ELIMR|nr:MULTISPECIES: hypothetical protein [Elizabethkingia]MDV2448931.1 hypothetical protein [Elizabethkingia anophelis]OBS13473.1 hypothetical protein ATE49_12480 [Elizabethkingia miricola]TYO85276.1 hypothetical protein LX74_03511 [Elizabethkingia miricola]
MTKKEELQKLQKRMAEVKPIVSKSFSTDKELDDYKKKNQKIFNEYYELFEQIPRLEYELKTPEEKKEYDEYLRKLKLKSEGKPLI